jgi:hypothetical protein
MQLHVKGPPPTTQLSDGDHKAAAPAKQLACTISSNLYNLVSKLQLTGIYTMHSELLSSTE